ncbi:MAG: radical SAM protein [Elusimicrobia bacterium]|nr:radical SAM protein [Elusimicrobiota bacterium]
MNLLMFLSDRCNMACDYCFLALNTRPATILSEDDGARAVDAHLARFGRGARFTLLGGEPLLHPQLAAALARRAGASGAKVSLVTNGTKAAPEIIGEFMECGAEISVSLDGRAASHDAHRRALGGGPTHGGVLKVLAKLDLRRLRANLVISEDTVADFLANIEWLRRRGFARLSFHADAARPWTRQGLSSLSAALAGFSRYARLLQSGASSPWQLDSYLRARTEPPAVDEELVLGADGRYYAGDAWLSRPYGAGLDGAVGGLRDGVDWEKRGAILAGIDRAVARALDGAPYYTWPRETWTLAELAGRDASADVRAFCEADALLGGALSALGRERETAR